jgi:hypothetical protein
MGVLKTTVCAALLALASASSAAAAQKPRVRLSAWYWLNSAPKNEWQRDFKQMADLGFTDVLLAWGLDSSAFGIRVADSRDAINWAGKAGLGSFLCVWHPTHNTLERRPDVVQMDVAGHHLFTFDTFNPEWRRTVWRDYLHKLADSYGKLPGFAGYVFDDSFSIGPVGEFGGPYPEADDRYISYGAFERKAFGAELPKSKTDPAWQKWIDARAHWWNEWSADTVKFIREQDSNPEHIIYLEDAAGILGPDPIDRQGVRFGEAAQPFDAVCAYIEPPYSAKDSAEKIVAAVRNSINKTREAAGASKRIIFTFWVADLATERASGPAAHPTVDQIRAVGDAALALGITHLDMYGYRIGEYRATTAEWPAKRPGNGPTYPITGQFPKKFLWDRPELFPGLRAYFKAIQNQK